MRLLALAAALASLSVGASMGPPPAAPPVPAATGGEPADPYLKGFSRLPPQGFPTEEEAASGCHWATAAAIRELEDAGAIVDPSYEEYRVRKLACRWAADDPAIAECRFEKASVPGLIDREESGRPERIPERNWTPAAARFALVRPGGALDPAGPPRWVAADTCQPFVWKVGDGEIDLRAIARRLTR